MPSLHILLQYIRVYTIEWEFNKRIYMKNEVHNSLGKSNAYKVIP